MNSLTKWSGLGLSAMVLVGCNDKSSEVKLTEEANQRLVESAMVPVAKWEKPKASKKELVAAALKSGKTVYNSCIGCHQPTGAGLPTVFPPLAKSDWVNGLENSELIKIVLRGMNGEIKVNGLKFNQVMAPLGAQLDDKQVADVLTYVKNSFGNKGGYVAPKEVEALRSEVGKPMLQQKDVKGADKLGKQSNNSVPTSSVNLCEEAKPKAEAKAKPAVDAAVLKKAITAGKKSYTSCIACHQATGAGLPGVFPPLAKSDWVNGLANAQLIRIVLRGMHGEVKVNGVKYKQIMAPLGATMTDQQIADTLTYVKNSFGNKGGYVAPKEVKELRSEVGKPMLEQKDVKGADALGKQSSRSIEPAQINLCEEGEQKVDAAVLKKAIESGKASYSSCVACHQPTGAGLPGVFPPLAKSDWVNGLPNEALIKIVLRGMQGEVTVNGAKYKQVMAPLGSTMNDQQIADTLTYVKNSFGNKGGYVAPAEVKKLRGEVGKPMLTEAEVKGGEIKKPKEDGVKDAEKFKWLSEQIHKEIVKKSKVIEAKAMKPYTETAPLADDAEFNMVVIPGGTFKIGSPATEAGRKEDEGPQRTVSVEPFWMGEVEVTWELYRNFYDSESKARGKNGILAGFDKSKPLLDILTQPTTQYHDMFTNGQHSSDDEYPAMDMTNHAANKFCEWLSAQTGHYYRLPTEAEWEFAARGGKQTTYFWGNDAKDADKYAWYKKNANLTFNEVKLKQPNPYGLYDIIGNVAEWTQDQYDPKAYGKLKDGVKSPWNVPTKRYGRVFKGGSYKSDIAQLRIASREVSSKDLKDLDPQVPKSVWYHTFGQHIGFRVVRPLKVPTAEEAYKSWNTDEWSPARNQEDLKK